MKLYCKNNPLYSVNKAILRVIHPHTVSKRCIRSYHSCVIVSESQTSDATHRKQHLCVAVVHLNVDLVEEVL